MEMIGYCSLDGILNYRALTSVVWQTVIVARAWYDREDRERRAKR